MSKLSKRQKEIVLRAAVDIETGAGFYSCDALRGNGASEETIAAYNKMFGQKLSVPTSGYGGYYLYAGAIQNAAIELAGSEAGKYPFMREIRVQMLLTFAEVG